VIIGPSAGVGILLGILAYFWVGYQLLKHAQKRIAEDRQLSWPIWTYLWGVIITLPFGLATLPVKLIDPLGLTEPSSILASEMLILTFWLGFIPFIGFHLIGWVLIFVWIGFLLREVISNRKLKT